MPFTMHSPAPGGYHSEYAMSMEYLNSVQESVPLTPISKNSMAVFSAFGEVHKDNHDQNMNDLSETPFTSTVDVYQAR